jgi:hypothetical protein
MLPPQVLQRLLLLVVLSLSTQVASASMALKGCRDKCGNLTVPYPFGTTRGCSKDEGFLLTCNSSFNPPRLFLETPNSSSQVLQVTLDTLTISYTQITRHCFPLLPGQKLWSETNFTLGDLPYTLSSDLNRITVIGCDTFGAYTVDNESATGCFSLCSNTSAIYNGTCSGEGCCQGRIQKGTKSVRIVVVSLLNHTTTRNISNCSVAFPVQQDWYNFSYADVVNFTKTEVPVVLEWAIGNETCAEARRSEGFACVGDKTTCVDSESGEGYRCHCMDGYEGNPYLLGGCQGTFVYSYIISLIFLSAISNQRICSII